MENETIKYIKPCPHCGASPVSCHKKMGDYGMEYYLTFSSGCMHCFGKTGILRLLPLSEKEIEVCNKFPYAKEHMA